jgi:hypothetical protein
MLENRGQFTVDAGFHSLVLEVAGTGVVGECRRGLCRMFTPSVVVHIVSLITPFGDDRNIAAVFGGWWWLAWFSRWLKIPSLRMPFRKKPKLLVTLGKDEKRIFGKEYRLDFWRLEKAQSSWISMGGEYDSVHF